MTTKTADYKQGFNTGIKSAWIFSTPLGASDVLGARHIPRQIYDATKGGDPKDPKRSTGKSLGLAALAAGSGLFGLGFAGMGMRDLGLKMSIVAKRALQNRTLTLGEQSMAHRMDTPAYRRFGKSMGAVTTIPGVSHAMKATGYAAGGIAHPFNKLEDLITKGVVKTLGNDEALSLADKLHLTSQGQIFDNRAVRAMSSVAALPILIGGDALLAPYDPLKDEVRKSAEYNKGFMDKLAQYRSMGEIIGDKAGGGVGGFAAGMAPYMLPGVGTAASLYDAGAQVGNMFSKDKTGWQRLGHGAAALGNLGFAALNTVGGGFITGALKGVGKGVAKLAPNAGAKILNSAVPAVARASTAVNAPLQAGLKKAPGVNNYIQGTTAWQTAMKTWGRTPGVGPTASGAALMQKTPGFAAGAKRVAGGVGASPMAHAAVGAIGGGMVGGGQEGLEQGAQNAVGQSLGAIPYSQPIMSRQLGYQAGSYLR